MKIRPKKKWGQNFLIDKKIAQKIVESVDFLNKNVIEIGPGTGFLTAFLIKKAKFLHVYEIDSDLIPLLEKKFQNKKIKIINQDFLESQLNYEEKQILIANIPYNITSKILFKIFANITKFEKIILMVQNEVAQRITAKTGMDSYSKLSLICQYVAQTQILFKVFPESFSPRPKVSSAVVFFEIKQNLDFTKMEKFFWFTKMCFQMRRKTLYNNLKIFVEAQKIKKIYQFFEFSKNIRPQEIDLSTFVSLCDFYFSQI